jgi:hypothetical protein
VEEVQALVVWGGSGGQEKATRKDNKEKKPTLSPALALFVMQPDSRGAGERHQLNREVAACVNSRDRVVIVVVVECGSGEQRPQQAQEGRSGKGKISGYSIIFFGKPKTKN